MTVAWRIWYGPVKNTIYKYKKHKIYKNETFKIKDTQKRGLLWKEKMLGNHMMKITKKS